jgi:hypothetical protein
MGSMGENVGQWLGLHMIAVDSKSDIPETPSAQ